MYSIDCLMTRGISSPLLLLNLERERERNKNNKLKVFKFSYTSRGTPNCCVTLEASQGNVSSMDM